MERFPLSNLPQLSVNQMREVDRLMIEEWHISLLQMMENAGRNLADLSRYLLGGSVKDHKIVVLSGKGNNGGGGMAAARHLHNWGARVQVKLMGSANNLKQVPALQWLAIKRMGLPLGEPQLSDADMIIDAMLGYGLEGDPRPPISEWIVKANESGSHILALDTPSGLSLDSGKNSAFCIQAKTTLTLALPKKGLLNPEAKTCVGDLYLADIGVPPELYSSPSLKLQDPSPFRSSPLVKLV